MGMFDGGSSTQSTTSTPPRFVQDDLNLIMNKGKNWFNKKKGFNPYGSEEGQQPWTDFSPQTLNALGTMEGLASQPNPFYQGMANYTNSLIGGGEDLNTSGLQSMVNKKAITVVPQLRELLGQDANALDQYGRPIASGANGINTESDFRSLYNSQDADFEGVVDQTADDLSDQITRQFGGSSYGSPEHTGTIANQVGDTIARMRSQNFNQNLANKTGILGNISGIQGQNIGNQLGAAGALSGEQMGNRAQKAGVLGQMGNFQLQNNEFQRALQNDITGWSNQDVQNRLAGVDRADQVYNSQYLPAEKMAAVGNAYDAKNQEILGAKMDLHNATENADWNRLLQYFGMASGTGVQGNQTQTVEEESNPLSSILGAGILGSQVINPARFLR